MAKREIEYHEVSVTFVVSAREARRATERQGKGHTNATRAALSQLVYDGLTGNGTNSLDAEEIKIVIDGKPELG